MPFMVLVAALVAMLVSNLAGAPARAPGDVPSGAGVTVMTFNIQHGMTMRGRYDLQPAMDLIAKVSADVVGLQETTRNQPSDNGDDQPRRIDEGLTRATGRQWQHVY